jgi:Fe2+ transport system protein FeoA
MNTIGRILRFKVLDERTSAGPVDVGSLAALRPGASGRVVELAPSCVGFERRRLMDLGLVPGSVVERASQAPFGGPISFRLRGVTLALRPEQARLVSVEA